jgi:hypothetical protein
MNIRWLIKYYFITIANITKATIKVPAMIAIVLTSRPIFKMLVIGATAAVLPRVERIAEAVDMVEVTGESGSATFERTGAGN